MLVAGTYTISGSVTYTGSASNRTRVARIILNGTTVLAEGGIGSGTFNASDNITADVSTTVQLAVNDYVELHAFHSASAALNTVPSTATTVRDGTDFSMAIVGGSSGTPIPAVVNGQWVKGVGGAAVWAAITPADVAGVEVTAHKDTNGGYVGRDGSGNIVIPGNTYLAGTLVANTNALYSSVVSARATGDAQDRLRILNAGHIYMGDGVASTPDTVLYRWGANYLRTDGAFSAGLDLRVGRNLNVMKDGEANAQILMQMDAAGAGLPALIFGPGGATNVDIWLYRSGAGCTRYQWCTLNSR